MILERNLIKLFFEIRGNEQIDKLENLKLRCERYLLEKEDSQINDLINIINALIIYFETGNKVEARKWVIDLWNSLNSKKELSLFDIRILNCILFIEPDIEKIIKIIEDCLTQLDIYKFHKDYTKVKISTNLNLLILLVDAKFFDKNFKTEFDEIIPQKIREIITLDLKGGLNNKYYVAYANIFRGIFFRDEIIIHTGLLLLESSGHGDNHSMQRLLEMLVKKYNLETSMNMWMFYNMK